MRALLVWLPVLSDRRVKVLQSINAGDLPEDGRLSDFLHVRNLVLLGEPGMGKTTAFNDAARLEGAGVLTARGFMARVDGLGTCSTLYLDALDEKRSRGKGEDWIEQLAGRIGTIRPSAVRLSCRTLDWLGETDLALLRPIFEANGSYAILMLQELSKAEQIELLEHLAIQDPVVFASTAADHGVADLLLNPQTLIMLVAATRDGGWPKTRTELFEKATENLIFEHNRTRAIDPTRNFSRPELLEAAGAVCAIQLLSAADGISLLPSSAAVGLPSYDTVPSRSSNAVGEALHRRVFGALDSDSASYSHRTIAEFLAARWLAGKVRDGFPMSRLVSAATVDKYPVAELRGLFAWLPTFLPEYGISTMRSDPYAVLLYGDASSLAGAQQRDLVEALRRLGDEDPWFRGDEGNRRALGALSSPDTRDLFRSILDDKNSSLHFRSIILEAIRYGPAATELGDVLRSILIDVAASHHERRRAFQALLNFGPESLGELTNLLRFELLPRRGNARICADLMSRMPAEALQTTDFVDLIKLYGEDSGESASGELFALSSRLTTAMVRPTLSALTELWRESPVRTGWRRTSEITHFFDNLLVRFLQSCGSPEIGELWQFLDTSFRLKQGTSASESGAIKEWLSNRYDVARRLCELGWHQYDTTLGWTFFSEFPRFLAGAFEIEEFVAELADAAADDSASPEKRRLALGMALGCVWRKPKKLAQSFDALYDRFLRDQIVGLTLEDDLACSIERWEHEDRVKQAKAAAENAAAREKMRADFDRKSPEIIAGINKGWLQLIGEVYWSSSREHDPDETPSRRLAEEFGDARAAIALQALEALPGRSGLPSVKEVLDQWVKDKWFRWWWSILAGVDATWSTTGTLPLDHKVLSLLVTVESLFPVYRQRRNTVERANKGWIDSIYRSHTNLAADALVGISTRSLDIEKGGQNALLTLMDHEAFKSLAPSVCLDLLRRFPSALGNDVRRMIGCLARNEAMLSAAYEIAWRFRDADEMPIENKAIWSALRFLSDSIRISLGNYESVRDTAVDHEVWLEEIKRMSGVISAREKESSLRPMSIGQLVFLTKAFGSRDRYEESPDWEGDDHDAWERSRYVMALLAELSSRRDKNASTAFGILIGIPELSSYENAIRHHAANQRRVSRQARFVAPAWTQCAELLRNGRPDTARDLMEFTVDQLTSVQDQILNSNIDPYKLFWNEDSYGRPTKPKPEESARDALVGLLRPLVSGMGIRVDPEDHRAQDKRADIAISVRLGLKMPIEVKRDYHAELWRAREEQLDRLYARDPEADGCGVYLVFWYGVNRPVSMPSAPDGVSWPTTAAELATALNGLIPEAMQQRQRAVVIDVTRPVA